MQRIKPVVMTPVPAILPSTLPDETYVVLLIAG